jgi:hypothetical protein
MNRLPKHEDTEEKQAAYEYLNRWNKNHKVSHILIMLGVIVLFGVLMYWLKSSGFIFGLR